MVSPGVGFYMYIPSVLMFVQVNLRHSAMKQEQLRGLASDSLDETQARRSGNR
jgi:hypothetical protein